MISPSRLHCLDVISTFDCSTSPSSLVRAKWVVLVAMIVAAFFGSVTDADESDEVDARNGAQRFLTVLLANPRYGTAFDRVYGFHIDRGSIAAFRESLRVIARLSDEFAPDAGTTTSEMIALELPANTDPGAACLLFGLIELRHSESASAIIALQHAVQFRPGDAMSHWTLAKAFIMAQKPDEAIASLEKAIACQPAKIDLLELYKELARNLQRAQRTDDALNAWKRLESEFPGDLRVKEQIAATLAEDGRWDEALTRYQALAKESKNSDQRVAAILAGSDVMIQLGRNQDAIKSLESQLNHLDSDSWLYKDIRRRIENIFRGRDDLSGLVAYYEAWVKAHPEDVDAMARLGRTLSLQNNTAEAADWYRRAITLAPSTVSLRESLIEQLVRDNNIADALAQYEAMSKFDAGHRDHLEDWGQLYLSQKDVPLQERQSRAAAVWDRLLENRADDPVTLAKLASLMRRAELQDRAIALYRSAIEKAPHEPQYREYLGEYLNQLTQTDDAVAVWTEIASGDRRNKANLIRRAEVFNRFGQTDLGIASMRDACSLNPDPLERVQFAEMLCTQRAAGRQPSDLTRTPPAPAEGQNAESHSEGSHSSLADDLLIAEAIEQLSLAERSAETPDERQQILRARVKCLLMSGQLEQQIEQLSKELASGTDETPERWRTLTMYQDAHDEINEATASAMKVVELEPDSILGWTMLADLNERTGRLGDAADAMTKLASLDRRGISEYLRKTARFQVRLGQFDAALATGRDVIKATPGNPEAYQFFADLAFEVGQPTIAVESLRQAVRVNPGDEMSLRALAKTLADEFQTPEAIELYWRAFEKASDLESQTQIVVALSNLYLRSNQFPKLIERLELRSRELNLPTEMTRCIATAYRESGDFGKARESLDSLLIDSPSNVSLLKELSGLAMLEHNKSAVIEYQRHIVRSAPSEAERRQLVKLLDQSGSVDEANQILVNLALETSTIEEFLPSFAALQASGQRETANTLLDRKFPGWSDNWELAFAVAQSSTSADAKAIARRIVTMQVDGNARFQSPAAGGLPGASWIAGEETPAELGVWLDAMRVGSPRNFGEVFSWCANVLVGSPNEEPSAEDLALIFRSEVLSHYGVRPFANLITSLLMRQIGENTKSFVAADQVLPQSLDKNARILRLAAGVRIPVGLATMKNPLGRKTVRAALLEQLPTVLAETPEWIAVDRFGILPFCDKAFNDGHADQLHSVLKPLAETIETPSQTIALIRLAYLVNDVDLTVRIVHRIAAGEVDCLTDVEVLTTFIKDEGLGSALSCCTRNRRPEGLFDLLALELKCQKPWSLNQANLSFSPTLTSLDELERHCSGLIGVTIKFLTDLHVETEFNSWLTQQIEISTPDQLICLSLIQARIAELQGDSERTLIHLIAAAELRPENESLQFLIATNAIRLGLVDEAIELLDAIRSQSVELSIAREFLVLKHVVDVSQSARTRLAAERLFGLPLSIDDQKNLIPYLKHAGFDDKVVAIESRLGRDTETRQSILGRQLQLCSAQGKNELAGEAAWELLKLASGGALFSGHRPNDDRDDGGERLQAIKALGKLKRLQPLIDRYEAMLHASPESLDLLEILCEFHEAAEQFPQLAEKRDRIALLSNKTPPSLKAKAVALENSGDVSGACDIYLQILKDDPEAFAEEIETYVQAFERAKRHADFLTAVLNLDAEHWSGNAGLLVNMIAELARAKTNDDVVRKSIETMLANRDTRRLAIGGFLARPDVIAEERLLTAIQDELESEDAFSNFIRGNETFLIMQGVRSDASLKVLQEFLTSRLATGRQLSAFTPGKTTDIQKQTAEQHAVGAHRPVADITLEALLIYCDARLVNRADVERRVAKLVAVGLPLNEPATNARLSRPTVPPSVQDSWDDTQGVESIAILALNSRLKELSKDWDGVRRSLLETLVSQSYSESKTTDTMLEELGAVYESLGETAKAHGILNQRVRQMLASTGASDGDASESIRQLLQSGEKIQASGFPIEGARLLLNVTPHDIDEFTSDLDDDKAIAFKSRFNASQRWARQQISAEKLLTWFEMSIAEIANTEERVDNKSQADLLLEISGTTDPQSRDLEQLKQLRLESVLLNGISKQSFDSDELKRRTQAAIAGLLQERFSDVRLLGVALALARQLQLKEHDPICQRLSASAERVGYDGESESEDPKKTGNQHEPIGQSAAYRIPEILRSDAELACVLIARGLATQSDKSELVTQLLDRSAEAARRCPDRLVRIAVFQECAAVAQLAGLAELATTFDSHSSSTIAEHLKSTLSGAERKIDLAQEIRVRLLKRK